MATNKQAKIQMESSRVLVPFALMTDSGDAQNFTADDAIMSGDLDFLPEIVPNGIVTGQNLGSPAVSGTADLVDVAAFSAAALGAVLAVSASADKAITRPATAVAKINSVTMTSVGVIAVVAGLDGLDTTLSEVRGATGGPPFIPVDDTELFQVHVISNTAAAITEAEIFQNPGQHSERSRTPELVVNTTGLGTNASLAAQVNAYVRFNEALPLIHTASVPKRVYAQYYVPSFSDLQKPSEFVPSETSHALSSEEYYGGQVGTSTPSVGQATFNAILQDGINDQEVVAKNKVATFKFFQNKNKPGYILTQGVLGIARTFEVAGQSKASLTVSPENASVEFSS